MDLKTQLKGHLKKQHGKIEKEFLRCCSKFSEEIKEVSCRIFKGKTENEILSIDELPSNSILIDAYDYIKSDVVSSSKIKIYNLELESGKKDIYILEEKIIDYLKRKDLIEKSFVYVAWKGRPEVYNYVGKASSSSRMKLSSHGKLLEALKGSRIISFVVPKKTTQNSLKNIESSLIAFLTDVKDQQPIYNDRREDGGILPGRGSRTMNRLMKILSASAKKIA